MTQTEINTYAQELAGMTDAQLAAAIYEETGETTASGMVAAFNAARWGPDVRMDITKIAMLLREYFARIKTTTAESAASAATQAQAAAASAGDAETAHQATASMLASALFGDNALDVILTLPKTDSTHRGVDITCNADGTFGVNGTSTADTYKNLYSDKTQLPDRILPGKTYQAVFNRKTSGGVVITDAAVINNLRFYIEFFKTGQVRTGDVLYLKRDAVITVPSDAVGMNIRLYILGSATFDHEVVTAKILTSATNAELLDMIASAGAYDLVQKYRRANLTSYGIVFDWLPDGSCRVNGTTTATGDNYSSIDVYRDTTALPDGVIPNGVCRVKFRRMTSGGLPVSFVANGPQPEDIRLVVRFNDGDGARIGNMLYISGDRQLSVPGNAVGLSAWILVNHGVTIANEHLTVRLMTSATNAELSAACEESAKNDAVFEYYGDFAETDKWYTVNGLFSEMKIPNSDEYRKHSQLLRIRPNTEYYLSSSAETLCMGAFFDLDGNWIAPLYGDVSATQGLTPRCTPITASYDVDTSDNTYAAVDNVLHYRPAQAAGDGPDLTYYPANVATFKTLYRFVSPPDAHFISLNLWTGWKKSEVCDGLCSKMIFMLRGTGNLILRRGDPALSRFGHKKLCVIGPSTIMLDRLIRAYGGGEVYNSQTGQWDGVSQYIAGCQEYLAPFFADVKSYGYSGAPYHYGGIGDNRCSIYTRLVGGTETVGDSTYTEDPVDLSGFDVYLLVANANGVYINKTTDPTAPSNIGRYDDSVNVTYLGALRAIIDYIYTQNPSAEIYLSSRNVASIQPVQAGGEHLPNQNWSNSKLIAQTANAQFRLLAEDLSLHFIDCDYGLYNQYNRDIMTERTGHGTNEGNRLFGMFLRKHIIGI